MTTFADLMALLLTFFVLMLSLSKTDIKRYEQALVSMKNAFGQPWHGRVVGTEGVIGDRGLAAPLPQQVPTTQETESEGAATNEEERDDPLYKAIEATLANDIAEAHIELERRGGEIVVRFPEHISFPSASADLQDDFLPILERLAAILTDTRRNILVVGHTDDRPIATQRYRSNWDLSAARASSVVHQLIERSNIAASQIIAQGRAESVPLVANDSEENRAKNRRVEIVIMEGQ